MNLPTIPIRDHMFGHAHSTSGDWLKPAYFTWDRENLDKSYVILTDNDVTTHEQYAGLKKYAWLIESPVITPQSYNYVYDNWQKFDVIFTHVKRLLERPNAKFLPIGMCHLKEEEISLDYEKSKLVSMIYSGKNYAPGHPLRHAVAKEFGDVVDLMGSGVTGQHVRKIFACKEYMYSIAIENCQEDFYFSEKILDCFLTGVIPIYCGCPSIGNFFNMKGVFTFNTLVQLYDILKDQEYLYNYYDYHRPVIKENFANAMKYKVAEDRLFLDYRQFLEI